MTDTLKDLLDRINDVTADVCGWCQKTLGATAYSRTFCRQDHQARWQALQAGVAPDPELLDDDLPMPELRSRIASQLSQRLPGAQVFINGHDVPFVNGSLRVFVDEIASLGAGIGEAVAFPRLADLRAEHARQQDLEQHRRRMLDGDWMFTDPTPIGEVFAQLGEFIPGFVDGIRAATPQDGKPPTDPRARALWLRKHPNTGPKPRRRRPPKNLMP